MKRGQDNLAFFADVKKSILFGNYITKVLFAAFPFYVLAQHKEENKKGAQFRLLHMGQMRSI